MNNKIVNKEILKEENETLKENNKKILEFLKIRSLKTQVNNKAIFFGGIDATTMDIADLKQYINVENSNLINEEVSFGLHDLDYDTLKKNRNKNKSEETIYSKIKELKDPAKDGVKILNTENTKRDREYKKFKRIFKLNKAAIKENGDNKLFFATYFIEMDVADVQVRAPLIFFTLDVKFNDRERKITLKIDNKPMHNFSLLTLISTKNNKPIESFVFEKYLSSNSKDLNEILVELKATYKKLGFVLPNVKLSKWFDVQDLQKIDKKVKNTIANKNIDVYNYSVIGMFSLNEGFVFNDLNKLLDDEKWINSVLSISGTIDRTFNINDYSKGFSEDKVLLFNDIDLYQQNAIKMATEVTPVVIQGPPGTGKTQTIINLALNLIEQNKKILIVSEKQTALDVIYERLNFASINLQSFVFNLSLKNNKDKFFGQFTALDELLEKKIDGTKNKGKLYLNYKDYLDQVLLINNIKNIKLENTNYVLNDLYEFALSHKNDLFYKFPIKDVEWVKENFSELFDDQWLRRFNEYNKWESKLKFDLKGKDFVWLVNLNDKKLEETISAYLIYDKWISDLRKLKVKKGPSIYNLINYIKEQKRVYSMYFHDFDFNKYNQDQREAMLFILENDFIKLKDKDRLIDYLTKSKLIKKYEEVIDNFSTEIREISMNPLKIKALKRKYINNNLDYLYGKISKEFINTYYKNQKEINSLIKVSINSKNKSPILWVKKNLEILNKIYPITIATCEDVSEFLELKKEMYDYVIFDEASQIFFEKALPSIYRGKHIVVFGDTKQLRPSNFFETRGDLEIENDYMEFDDDYLDVLDSESILDFYEKNIKQKVMLKGHYRSKFNELIEFSNKNFYNGELWFENVASPYETAIEVHDVRGKWDNSMNLKEAQKVALLVKKFANDFKNTLKSIGIITFNVKQRDLIEEEINKIMDFNIRQLLELKNEKGEDISLFIKSIEDVQGDERDYIIFSIGYSSEVHNYGPISREGGENRINVAITRAIEKVIIVKSHPAKKYYGLASQLKGPKTFIKYLMYAEDVATNKTLEEQEEMLEDKVFNSYIEDIQNSIQQEIDLSPELKSKYKIEKYKGPKTKLEMDLVIYKDNIPFVTIIANEENVNNSFQLREQFIFKQEFLENRGWKVHRLNKYVWGYDKNLQLKIIKSLLN